MTRVRIFIDFWNFQLAWNDNSGRQGCDWRKLPVSFVRRTTEVFREIGLDVQPTLEQTLVYASVEAGSDERLRGWLTNTLDRFPSYTVKIRERRPRPKSIHCKLCGVDTRSCPNCSEPYLGASEKGTDVAMVTDLLSLAWEGAYDVAILVTSDADFIPAVEHVQAKGLKVVNAAWTQRGHDLQRACWATLRLDDLVKELCR